MPKRKKTAVRAVKKVSTRGRKPKAVASTAGVSVVDYLKSLLADAAKNTTGQSKSFETLKKQAAKAAEKQKAAKDKRVEIVKKFKAKPTDALADKLEHAKAVYEMAAEEATALKAELAEAKADSKGQNSEVSKFSALIKLVEKFEKKWAKANKPKSKRGRKAKAATTATASTASAPKKRGRKPKAKTAAASLAAAPKKRGRKPKATMDLGFLENIPADVMSE